MPAWYCLEYARRLIIDQGYGSSRRCGIAASHPDIQCSNIIQGDTQEITAAENVTKTFQGRCLDENWHLNASRNCSLYIKSQHYRTLTTKEEDNFPIAFSVLVHDNIEQLDRFLQAIYRPSNYYCIHVDAKSSGVFHKAVESIARCFPNVHKTLQSHVVKWAEIGILHAEIECMKLLWKYKKWKYLINLTGHEFPLKTNLQLVRILKELKGFNIIDGKFKGYVHVLCRCKILLY